MKKHFAIFAAMIFMLLVPFHTSASERIATGVFSKGFSTHGSVEVHQVKGKWVITFGEDFVHEGSPDPWIALGKGGFQRSGIIGELKQYRGKHSVALERLNPTEFNEIYIWCVLHNSNLGRAKIVWE